MGHAPPIARRWTSRSPRCGRRCKATKDLCRLASDGRDGGSDAGHGTSGPAIRSSCRLTAACWIASAGTRTPPSASWTHRWLAMGCHSMRRRSSDCAGSHSGSTSRAALGTDEDEEVDPSERNEAVGVILAEVRAVETPAGWEGDEWIEFTEALSPRVVEPPPRSAPADGHDADARTTRE